MLWKTQVDIKHSEFECKFYSTVPRILLGGILSKSLRGRTATIVERDTERDVLPNLA